ncbi:23238_t:CDS:1, partial [Gigaspora rosea]
IPPSDKNVLMADEAMITAITEYAFAESKSSPSFLYPVTPNSPSSVFLLLHFLKFFKSIICSYSSSPITGPPIIT